MYINEAYGEACCRYLHKINIFEVSEQLHFSDAYTFEEIEKDEILRTRVRQRFISG
jgi:hypothetical protein